MREVKHPLHQQGEKSPAGNRVLRDFMRGLLVCGMIWYSLMPAGSALADGGVRGRVVDSQSGEAVVGVAVQFDQWGVEGESRGVLSDSTGHFRMDGLAPGSWILRVEILGYETAKQEIEVGEEVVETQIGLQVQPLVMDEMLVRARRFQEKSPTPAFVEVIEIQEHRPGISLPEILDQAVGVDIRSSGGMGSFSTVSIRGSTAEQVQVFLDGVPLNQALGGGVNMGDLPVEGVESIEVYRGAVPARFGGNSIGGVVHIRTQEIGSGRRARAQAMVGSWGTRQFNGSVAGAWRGRRYLVLVDYAESQNDFSFWDDNGTEYNSDDDEWATRRNNDTRSLRTLVKVEQPTGRSRLQVHNTFDLKHQGIPNISNNQSLHTRLDKWRSITEVEVFGTLTSAGRTGYRMTGYHLLQQYEYEDPEGTVGVGTQHDRNTTRSAGLRAELNRLLFDQGVLTVFAGGRHETFDPEDLLRPKSRLLESRRRSASAGWEGEIPLWHNLLQVTGGSQMELIADTFYGKSIFGTRPLAPNRENTEVLWGGRVGGQLRLTESWTLKGHRGWYQRPPSFFELFGDRGAVVGNTDLESERGDNWDVGLVWRRFQRDRTGVQLLEAVFYRNQVEDLIRFVQNAQRVSRPHNFGRARIQGLEVRGQMRLVSLFDLSGSYVFQQAENRSPVSYEKDNDLPNAPRHKFNFRAGFSKGRGEVHYDLNRESRHFLDRANLRPVASRIFHGLGGSFLLRKRAAVSLEVRNLTSDRVADLWGYPLPGRSYFISVRQNVSSW